jgi:uncharacterized DUF497 family protein
MNIEFDSKKSDRNDVERALPFDDALLFDWDDAVFREDVRKAYPERRFIALGYLHARVHYICFTPKKDSIRIISLRRANKKEVAYYEQEQERKTANR